MQTTWLYQTAAAQASTDSYADVGFTDEIDGSVATVVRAFTSGPLSAMIKNPHGTNGVTYRILGSNDQTLADADWAIVTAEAGLAALAKVEVTHALAYYLFYKVQVKATSAGNQGSATVNVLHKRV